MKEELLQLITLTELYLFDNHPLPKKKRNSPSVTTPLTVPLLANNPIPKNLPQEPPSPRLQEIKETVTLKVVKETPIEKKEDPLIFKAVEKDYVDIAKFFRQELPQVKVHAAPPKDDLAKTLASTWTQKKPIAAIAIFTIHEKELKFLKNIADSLSIRNIEVKTMEINDIRNNNIDDIKFILTTTNSLRLSEKLHSLREESPVPICIMEEPAFYFSNPLKKADLWRELLSFVK